jgi:ribosomal protein S6--L-glutamate ligase
MMCDLVIEKGKLDVIYEGESLTGYDAVIPRIGSSVTTFGTSVVRQFEKMGVFTVTRAESILKARNKLRTYQILAAEGIAVPKTLLPNYAQFDEELMRELFHEPLIVKLLESTHGLGVIRCDSFHNAASTIEAFFRMKHKIMVQEFIKESSGTDIRAFVVDGVIEASMKRIAPPGEFRSNLHRGATARVESLTEPEKFMVRKVSKLIDLEIAGIDILRSNKGPLLLEVNSSPGLEGIETVSGVDIAGSIIKYTERRVRKRKKYLMRKES